MSASVDGSCSSSGSTGLCDIPFEIEDHVPAPAVADDAVARVQAVRDEQRLFGARVRDRHRIGESSSCVSDVCPNAASRRTPSRVIPMVAPPMVTAELKVTSTSTVSPASQVPLSPGPLLISAFVTVVTARVP